MNACSTSHGESKAHSQHGCEVSAQSWKSYSFDLAGASTSCDLVLRAGTIGKQSSCTSESEAYLLHVGRVITDSQGKSRYRILSLYPKAFTFPRTYTQSPLYMPFSFTSQCGFACKRISVLNLQSTWTCSKRSLLTQLCGERGSKPYTPVALQWQLMPLRV